MSTTCTQTTTCFLLRSPKAWRNLQTAIQPEKTLKGIWEWESYQLSCFILETGRMTPASAAVPRRQRASGWICSACFSNAEGKDDTDAGSCALRSQDKFLHYREQFYRPLRERCRAGWHRCLSCPRTPYELRNAFDLDRDLQNCPLVERFPENSATHS